MLPDTSVRVAAIKRFRNRRRAPNEICEVCFWEDDRVQFDDPDYADGANAVSLREALSNYKEFGVSELRFKANIRPPRPDELP